MINAILLFACFRYQPSASTSATEVGRSKGATGNCGGKRKEGKLREVKKLVGNHL